jgi:hypothetical protein
MAQLDITTFFTQSFWLITIFLLTYLIIGYNYLPKISFIVKYRSEYQNDRNWSLTILTNEIRNVEDFLLIGNEQRKKLKKILTKFQTLMINYQSIIQAFLQTNYKKSMQSIVVYKFSLQTSALILLT